MEDNLLPDGFIVNQLSRLVPVLIAQDAASGNGGLLFRNDSLVDQPRCFPWTWTSIVRNTTKVVVRAPLDSINGCVYQSD
jgi:hypothetical protein